MIGRDEHISLLEINRQQLGFLLHRMFLSSWAKSFGRLTDINSMTGQNVVLTFFNMRNRWEIGCNCAAWLKEQIANTSSNKIKNPFRSLASRLDMWPKIPIRVCLEKPTQDIGFKFEQWTQLLCLASKTTWLHETTCLQYMRHTDYSWTNITVQCPIWIWEWVKHVKTPRYPSRDDEHRFIGFLPSFGCTGFDKWPYLSI